MRKEILPVEQAAQLRKSGRHPAAPVSGLVHPRAGMSNPQQLSYNFTRRVVLRIQKTRRKGYHTCDELSGGVSALRLIK